MKGKINSIKQNKKAIWSIVSIFLILVVIVALIIYFKESQKAEIPYGELKILEAKDDAGDEYLDKVTFLIDSTYIGLRDLNLVEPNQVWATMDGALPIEKINSSLIVFPNDGSELRPATAATIIIPEILVIGIGMDGLADVDKGTFITEYDTLINDIYFRTGEDTVIICCGLPSVIPGYSGSEGLTAEMAAEGNEWVKMVCRDTGAYFLDVQETLSENGVLAAGYSSANGKSLNRAGLQKFLTYLCTHPVA